MPPAEPDPDATGAKRDKPEEDKVQLERDAPERDEESGRASEASPVAAPPRLGGDGRLAGLPTVAHAQPRAVGTCQISFTKLDAEAWEKA